MVKKKQPKTSIKNNESYILPSSTDEMREFVEKFKIDMMEHIISSIKFAVENKLPIVEVFQFTNSPFVVTISEKEFVLNLEHINKFYKDQQIFELCQRVEQLKNLLKNKPDEKEKSKKSGTDKPTQQ
jgi:hypothetical protein